MKFTYLKTPLNKFTFKSKKIKNWVENNAEGNVLNLFAGEIELDLLETRNDLNPDRPADFHLDALELVNMWRTRTLNNESLGSVVYPISFKTVLLDPPYSYRKSMEMYKGYVASPFNQLKDAIVDILAPNGIIITFGYHSVSMGKKRGFKQEHLCVMSHGGAIHDTIAIIERKI